MTCVVADSGPLRYLVVISEISVLPRLFDEILLPAEVQRELRHPNAPEAVRAWTNNLPTWAKVTVGKHIKSNEMHEILGPGESAAIGLAEELCADFVLLDEIEARAAATARGLKIMGTVGILERAAKAGLIDLANGFRKLQKTNFRIDPKYLAQSLARNTNRRGQA